jgi:hypothetical protein
MNLEEWIATDRATRERLEAECYRRGTPRQIGELASEAAKALAKELAQQPQITAVIAGEDNAARRSILMVTTSRRAGEKLTEIPDEFAGFPVVQFGVAERKKDYLQRLEFVLRAANVTQAEVDTWLKRFESELNNIGSVYYAETPARWIAEALIAAKANGGLMGEMRIDLRGKLWAVIDDCLKEIAPERVGLDEGATLRLRASLQNVFAGCGINI